MNVRKRGLALLMCICMIFTLLPFSVFAEDAENGNRGGTEGTAQQSVVYGKYDNGTWKQDAEAKDTVTETVDTQGNTITLKKTATPTGNENEYKIDLEVITTETSSTKAGDAATVLVIDVSGSMDKCAECGYTEGYSHNWNYGHNFKSRIAAAQTAAKQFIDAFKSDSAKRYVSVVRFSDNASVACEWKDVSTLAGYKAAIKAIEGLSADGGTNLDAGLQTANTQLSKTTVASIKANAKNVIALTDGMPTYYQGASGSVSNHASTGCPITNDRTAASATTLKNSAALYTVCFGASNDKCWSDWEYNKRDDIYEYGSWPGKKYCSDSRHAQDGPTVGDFLKNSIATQATNDKTYAYNAANTNDLLDVFKSITDTITEGISAGTVKDGLPTGVSFVGDAPTAFVENADGTYSWELIPENAKKGTDGEKTTYTYKVSYVVTLDTSDPEFNEDIYHALNTETTFTAGGKVYKFNVPGVKGTAPRYKVTYEYTGTVPTGAPELPKEASYKAGVPVTVADAPTLAGYEFSGWTTSDANITNGSFTMPSNKVTLTGSWALRSDLSYTVHYYWNGTNDKVAEDKTVEGKTFNETVTETPVPVNGYTPVSADSKTITIGTGTNEITFYYYKNVTLTAEDRIVTYNGQEQTVNTGYDVVVKADNGKDFKLSGVDFKGVHASGTGKEVGKYDIDFVGETVGKTDTTAKYIVANTVKGTLTITPIDTVVVTIKGNTDSKVYNGTEQSVTGYDVEISDPKYTRDDFKFTGNDKVYRTDVGTTYMGLKAEQFENKNSNFDKVTFVIENDGYVEVTKRTVTLTSETASKTYDGTPLTKPEVTVTGDGFVLGEVTDIKATGSVTNVSEGEVTNKITFVHGDAFNADNYNIETSEGKLSITPLAVTVTAKDYTKYVGEKDPAFEATVTGTINNDTVSYTISREKGETAGTYSITPAGAEAQGNYTVTYNAGTLTIKERPYIPPVNPPITDKITVEITGNSDSVVYDGAEHSVKDYTVKISDSRYTEKDFTFSGKALASGINAGTYEMGLKADQFKNTNARFKNVEFIIKADGVLTITQRPLTITAGSAEGIAPVTCDKYTVEGLATGDKVDSVKITGIQSEPGESPNVASDAVIKNAKGEDVTANYKITYVDGVLKAIEVLNKEIHFNYVIGYTDGTIRPNNDISRAEVATIFFRLLTDEAREQYTTTAGNFTDVKAGMWCNRAIATLTNMGIIKGYTDGSFQPNKSITRAELATIIARFAKLDVNTKTFSDITGHWAQKNIELAAGNGWINGYEDGTFRPNNNITRAETFAMINRVLDRQTESVSDLLPTSEMNMWSDNLNENAWYYKDVQEATNYHKCDRVGDSVYEKWTEKVPDIDWASYQI
jgi:uncharacterized repeat protein (TIGR02543 family)